jgi:carboxyl-terminal processing protease
MARKLGVLHMAIYLSLAVAEGIQATAGSSFSEIVKEAWSAIEKNFVDPTYNHQDWDEVRKELLSREYSTQEEAYRAIREMVDRLGISRTQFLDAKEKEATFAELSQGSPGVGLGYLNLDFDPKTAECTVITPQVGSSAFRAGIQPLDRIEAINGTAVTKLGRAASMMALRSPPGTRLTLSLRRGDRGFDVRLSSEPPTTQVVHGALKREGRMRIGYIALMEFTGNAPAQMREAIQGVAQQKAEGLVLDLRNNPGGFTPALREIAGMFLDSQVIYSSSQRSMKSVEEKAPGTPLTRIPLIVLVNRGTTSAAEILAGALQDNHRARLVGVRTHGHGLANILVPLSDDSALMISSYHIRTPDGHEIEGKGITPDFPVDATQKVKPLEPQAWAGAKDPQYMKAVSLLKLKD